MIVDFLFQIIDEKGNKILIDNFKIYFVNSFVIAEY